MNMEKREKHETSTPLIKVVGVGGGGCNVVKQMHTEGIKGVSFALCNTDFLSLAKSDVPTKIELGKEVTQGLGAGANPEIGKQAAEESASEIKDMLSDGTKIVLITAGMGGGTGTGGAPIVAKIAKEMGLLTIGFVTMPFAFEGDEPKANALRGVAEMKKNVDALLMFDNEQLISAYPILDVWTAFKQTDDVLASIVKSIAENITVEGTANLDFSSVRTTLKAGGVAVIKDGVVEINNNLK
jgi:cell division protein FtsZ